MPIDLHRSSDGADMLVPLISELNDDIAGIPLHQLVPANLTCRKYSPLYGIIQAVEPGANVIT
jgi:hypothetical protein